MCASRSANAGGSKLPDRKWSGESIERALAADRALAHRLEQRQRVDTRLDAHGERFGQRALDHVARAVVHQLGDRPRADRADVHDLVADRVEHRLVLGEDVRVAADPDRELARAGAGSAHR